MSMLSTKTRLQVEFLCGRIERGEQVPLTDMVWLDKWAKSNRIVFDMVQRARRRAATGPVNPESLDGLLDGLNLGDPDPTRHITSASSVDDLADFFSDGPDWMRRD
jgi:hypothetical protein